MHIAAIVFAGVGGAFLTWFLPVLGKRYGMWKALRSERRAAQTTASNARMAALELRISAIEEINGQILVFISGTEDPFTHVRSGGLLLTLKRIEDSLGSVNE